MSRDLEWRLFTAVEQVLKRKLTASEKGWARDQDFVSDAELQARENSGDFKDTVRSLVQRVTEYEELGGGASRVESHAAPSRPPGAALDARYTACEAWLGEELGEDPDVLSWRKMYLIEKKSVFDFSTTDGDLEEPIILYHQYQENEARNVVDQDVQAWVLQRLAEEGGQSALQENLTGMTTEQHEVLSLIEAQIPADLFQRWTALFTANKPREIVNLAVPTPTGSQLQTVFRDGCLGKLDELVQRLATRHTLLPASVTGFIIAGNNLHISGSTGKVVARGGPPSPSPRGSITMVLDASLSPEQVAGSFRRMRDQFFTTRPTATEKQGKMVSHAFGRVSYGLENLPWSEPRRGPGRQRISEKPIFVVRPNLGESWQKIIDDWNRTEALASLGRIDSKHASRDFTAAFKAVFQPMRQI